MGSFRKISQRKEEEENTVWKMFGEELQKGPRWAMAPQNRRRRKTHTAPHFPGGVPQNLGVVFSLCFTVQISQEFLRAAWVGSLGFAQ